MSTTVVSVLLDSLATTNVNLQDKWNEMIGAKEVDLSYSIAAGVVAEAEQLDRDAVYDKETINKILAAANPSAPLSRSTPNTPEKERSTSSRDSKDGKDSVKESRENKSVKETKGKSKDEASGGSAPGSPVVGGGTTKTKVKVKKQHVSPELAPLSPEDVWNI